ncbi:uncharacterized protein LOC132544260 [Ylistrum balloti]|uniref:uncharacterized protein LOC132544260 n=1 Tax=Ylistrum balloti TaxID=509963 RepID=UPI002905C8BC|nr:uncharacterized protein LOC132544260 [Ylistrum balloti]
MADKRIEEEMTMIPAGSVRALPYRNGYDSCRFFELEEYVWTIVVVLYSIQGKMDVLNTIVSILFILVSCLGSVAEAIRIRTTYYRSYRYYYYYDYTTYTLSAGVIAGIVIGSLIAVALLVGGIILCCVCCCGQRRNRSQAGQVIGTQPAYPAVSTIQTNATVAYYPTAPENGPQQPQVNQGHYAPPPSYTQVTSDGNVNFGFEGNKETPRVPPS